MQSDRFFLLRWNSSAGNKTLWLLKLYTQQQTIRLTNENSTVAFFPVVVVFFSCNFWFMQLFYGTWAVKRTSPSYNPCSNDQTNINNDKSVSNTHFYSFRETFWWCQWHCSEWHSTILYTHVIYIIGANEVVYSKSLVQQLLVWCQSALLDNSSNTRVRIFLRLCHFYFDLCLSVYLPCSRRTKASGRARAYESRTEKEID
jgi:hypothetical protein